MSAGRRPGLSVVSSSGGGGGGGSGDVVGPASTTDNVIVRFNGGTGKLITGGTDAPQYDDDGNIIMVSTKTVDGRDVSADGATLDTAVSNIAANTVALAGKVSTSTQVIAGAGCVGGGTLAADRTIDVAATDASIAVAANGIAVGILQSDAQHGSLGGGTLHADVVAGGASGFMSGTQATKLAGIATGATANANGTSVPNDSVHGPLLPTALVAANVTDALNNAWANNPESVVPFFVRPTMTGATPSMSGPIGVQTATGAVTFGTRAGSYLQSRVRLTATTTAVAGNVAGAHYTTASTTFGFFYPENGIRLTYRFGYETLTTAMRSFAGITRPGAPTNVDPNTIISMLGVGAPVGSGNLQWYNNDATGTAVQVDLGINFPISLRATYEVTIVIPSPASGSYSSTYSNVYYRVRRLDVKGAVAYGSLTTEFPTAQVHHCFTWWCSNNTDAAICALALPGVEGSLPY